MIGFSPMAMKSATPTMTKTLATSDRPRKIRYATPTPSAPVKPIKKGFLRSRGRPSVPRDSSVSVNSRSTAGGRMRTSGSRMSGSEARAPRAVIGDATAK